MAPTEGILPTERRHSFAVVDGEEHTLEIAAGFVIGGLENSDRILLIGLTDRRADLLLTRLREDGTDPTSALRERQLVIVDQTKTRALYTMPTSQVADELDHQATAAVRAGYAGIRFGGLLPGTTVSPHEQTLSRLVKERPATALCLYDGQALAEVLTQVHCQHDRQVPSTAVFDDGELRITRTSRNGLRLAGRIWPGNRLRTLAVLADAAGQGRRTIDIASLREIDPASLHALLATGLGLKLRRSNPVVQRLARTLTAQTQPSASLDAADRTGAYVPGQTASELVINLVWRTFGHSATGRAQSVLDWAGLSSAPAGPVGEVANRHHIAPATLTNRVRQVRSRGTQTPLNPLQLRDAIRATQPTEDHLSRQRITQLLGLPPLSSAIE